MHNWEHNSRLPAYLLMAALVASCGGGGENGGLSTGGQASAVVQLATPSVSLGLKGSEVVALTLTESDGKTPIVGKTLTLVVSGSATVSGLTATDKDGKATFTINSSGVAEEGTITATFVDANGNKSVALMPLKYTVLDGTGQVSTSKLSLDTTTAFKSSIPRTGSTQSIATFVLVDGAGVPISNATVNFALLPGVASTGRLLAASGVTDAKGKVSVTIDGLNQTVGANQLGVSFTDKVGAIASFAVPFTIVDSYEILFNAATTELKTGQGSVVLTARVLDASNALVKDAKVSFQVLTKEPKAGAECSTDTSNGTLFGSETIETKRVGTLDATSVVTNDKGQAEVTFEELDNKNSMRRIVATVDAEGLVSKPIACVDLNISGTSLVLDPPSVNAKTGDKVKFTASVKNGRNQSVNGGDVDFIVGGVSVGTVTLAGGSASKEITIDGNASVRAKVNSLNVTEQSVTPVTVAVSDLKILIGFKNDGTASTELPINSGLNKFELSVDDKGPVKGKVRISTTLGTLGAQDLVLDTEGKANTTFSSNFPGTARVDVEITKEDKTKLVGVGTVQFISTTPTAMTLLSSSSTLKPGEQAEVSAEVLDGNNPVKNQRVEFNIINPSGGSLSSSFATTDSDGKASVIFTAGNKDTAMDAIAITAKVAGTAVTSKAPVKFTVGGEGLFVSVATGNELVAVPGDAGLTNYALPVSVTVVDASGHPVRDQVVSLDLRAQKYYKGTYYFNDTARTWIVAAVNPLGALGETTSALVLSPKACDNEDVNRDGILDTGEDINNDGVLWIANPATVDQSVRTDNAGRATFNVLYGKRWANWLQMRLIATAKVSGSESKALMEFILPVNKDDINDRTKTPPGGVLSPFGLPGVTVMKDTDGAITGATVDANSCTLQFGMGGIH